MVKQPDAWRTSRREFVSGATLAAAASVASLATSAAEAGSPMSQDLTADEIRELLQLEPNQTCGFVKETYLSALAIVPGGLPAPFAAGRPLGSALYFMMTPQAPVKLHRIKNDQLYHYYLGDPIELLMLHADGSHTLVAFGSDLRAGQRPQLFIPGNTFHTAHIIGERPWFLGASTEWPGVLPEDVELGDAEMLAAKYPDVAAQIRTFPVPAS
jgi:predicted cupin superfamily sugar epimerase